MNKITLKNVYGREKKYYLQPMKNELSFCKES